MKRYLGLIGACVLGGLTTLAVAGGLRAQALSKTPAAPSANYLDVVINEVAWMGTAADANDEWIELYNNTDHAIDLTGWSIVAADGTPNISLSGAIAAHGYYLLERTDDSTVSDIPADNIYTGALENDPDAETLTLRDNTAQVIDTVNDDGGPWPAGDNTARRTMERINPAAPGDDANWGTNDGVTRNGLDANNNPINGTPRAQNSRYQPPAGPAADLTVAKTGPLTAASGSVITYVIAISNTGAAPATDVWLTDTLPAVVDLITQTSAFTDFHRSGRVLTWQIGDVPAATRHTLTVAVRVTDTAFGPFTNRITATTSATETNTTNNAASWTTTAVLSGEARVLISGALYDGYQINDSDEAVQLVNVGAAPANLAGWRLDDEATGTSYATFASGTLWPGQRIWVAWKGISFTVSFGFPPDYETVDTDPTIPNLSGSWPGYTNTGDEVVLRDASGAVVDTLVYKGGVITTAGWSGPAVNPYQVGNRALEGQILSRIPDEATGLPLADTDTAADWIQDTSHPAQGRRALYPGWDLDPLFWPLRVTETATVVVGVAPDNAFDVFSRTIASASQTISIEVYSLSHPEIITALAQKAREGISVTVVLEGQPAFESGDSLDWQQELWACQQIEAAGGQCWFMIHDAGRRIFNRYDYLHLKLLIVDGAWVVIGSQNLTVMSLPSDDKTDGSYGSRGVILATDAPSVVARAAQVFALDLDPARHNDLLRWSPALTGTYGPPTPGFTPLLTVPNYASVTVYLPEPLAIHGAFGFELFTAPEAALRQSDALLGLVARAGAGDTVYVEQLYEYVDWGDNPIDAPNLRLEAYIEAARRGARVRILLNGGAFGQLGFRNVNTATVAYVNAIAQSEGLDLRAAIGDPTRYGIHNKMVLVWLDDAGGYVHVGSINGSEGSNKINREMAIQVHADEAFAYLEEMFARDWQWAQPLYLPLVMRRYVPPADHLLVSEVMYYGYCEWVEIYNPTPLTLTLTGYKVGDAQTPSQYEGMYIFPARAVAPGEVILVAGDATQCRNITVNYELFGADPSVPNLTKDPAWGAAGGTFGLGNAGDEVLLLDPANRAVDVVVYGSGSYPGVIPHPGVESGKTLERIPAYADTDDCSLDFVAGWSPNSARFSAP